MTYDAAFPPPANRNVPVPTRVCPDCKHTLPEPDFLIGQDGVTRCLPCHEAQPAKLAAQQEEAEKAERFRQLVSSVAKVSAPTITDLNNALMKKFGSLDAFADFYHEQMMAAATTTSGKGSAKVLNACSSISKIVVASTAYQASLSPVAQLTDAELADEYKRELMEVVRRMPEEELQRLREVEMHDESSTEQSQRPA